MDCRTLLRGDEEAPYQIDTARSCSTYKYTVVVVDTSSLYLENPLISKLGIILSAMLSMEGLPPGMVCKK